MDIVCELSTFFKESCAKELYVEKLDELQNRRVITLCQTEKAFPLRFFTINCALNRGRKTWRTCIL